MNDQTDKRYGDYKTFYPLVILTTLVSAFALLNHYYKGLDGNLKTIQLSISHSASLMLDIRRQEKLYEMTKKHT